MKKYIFLLLIIVLCACSNQDRPEYKIHKIYYEGHSYIVFKDKYGYNHIVSDPDCKKCLNIFD